MSHGSAAARDIALGRRGGRWADDFDGPTTDGPPCAICRQPMIVGQRGVHLECRAATGGRTPVRNPVKVRKRDGGGTVCGRCWRAA